MPPREQIPALIALVIQAVMALGGASYSGLAAWAYWLGTQKTEVTSLERSLELKEELGLSLGATARALAELTPQHEKRYLELAGDGPSLVRLSLSSEFGGDPAGAKRWMGAAVERSRTYATFLAAASQASRQDDEEGLLRNSRLALAYCPRDADDVFHLLAATPRGASVLGGATLKLRQEYLRYLIGQNRLLEALEYQGTLEDQGKTGSGGEGEEFLIDQRRQLAEQLILAGKWEEAERLHPEPLQGGLRNANFEGQPTSIGFDWRLTQRAGARIDWRPGNLHVRLAATAKPQELLSQFVHIPIPKALGSAAALGTPKALATPKALGTAKALATSKKPGEARVETRWRGEVVGLKWHSERLHPKWLRLSLVAEAGAAREFHLSEVRLAFQ